VSRLFLQVSRGFFLFEEENVLCLWTNRWYIFREEVGQWYSRVWLCRVWHGTMLSTSYSEIGSGQGDSGLLSETDPVHTEIPRMEQKEKDYQRDLGMWP